MNNEVSERSSTLRRAGLMGQGQQKRAGTGLGHSMLSKPALKPSPAILCLFPSKAWRIGRAVNANPAATVVITNFRLVMVVHGFTPANDRTLDS
jgi:hypothetical protein